jgi:hypothetical protein
LLEAQVLEEIPDNALATESNKINGRLGRPSRMLRLDSSHPRFVGIQVGVTETRLAALPLGIGNEDRWDAQFATPGTAEEWITALRRTAVGIGSKGLWGVLVSVPGIVDEKAGRILFSPNLHWTEKVDLPGLVQEIWSAPVLLVQEERALALGHHAAAAERREFSFGRFWRRCGWRGCGRGSFVFEPAANQWGTGPHAGNRQLAPMRLRSSRLRGNVDFNTGPDSKLRIGGSPAAAHLAGAG